MASLSILPVNIAQRIVNEFFYFDYFKSADLQRFGETGRGGGGGGGGGGAVHTNPTSLTHGVWHVTEGRMKVK